MKKETVEIKKTRPKRKDGLRRQAQIMDIALDIFAEKGYHSTSVDDIINAAGVARGTFYLHFQGKLDIMDKIVESKLEELYSAVKVLDISQDRDLDELRNMYINVTKFFMGMEVYKKFIKLMLREYVGLDDIIFKRVNDFFDMIMAMTSGYIRNAQEEKKVSMDIDPDVTSFCIIGAVKELVLKWAVMDEVIDVDKTVNSMLNLFFQGMITEN